MIIAAAFACAVIAVHDGDTFRCGDGTRIRIAAVDANELDGSCHGECAPMSADKAQRRLEHLVLGRTVQCQQTGTSYERVVAFCSIGDIDVSCSQARAGAAIYLPRYDRDGAFARRCGLEQRR